MNIKLDKNLFMEVKQKLDFHKMPTIFEQEDLLLISKLLSKIQLLQSSKFEDTSQSNYKDNLVDHMEIEAALRQEIFKLQAQSNKLTLQIIELKDGNASLKNSLDRIALDSSKKLNHSEADAAKLDTFLRLKNKREKELVEEMTHLKYKYNQLMDLIHEDQNFERTYLKRLLKHKHIEATQSSDIVIDPFKYNSQSAGQADFLQENLPLKIKQLQELIYHRDIEILKLQRICQNQAISSNKFINKLQTDSHKNQQQVFACQLEFLSQENQKLKSSNSHHKLATHAKEVLVNKIQRVKSKTKDPHQQIKQIEEILKEKQEQLQGLSAQLKKERKINKKLTVLIQQQKIAMHENNECSLEEGNYLSPKQKQTKMNKEQGLKHMKNALIREMKVDLKQTKPSIGSMKNKSPYQSSRSPNSIHTKRTAFEEKDYEEIKSYQLKIAQQTANIQQNQATFLRLNHQIQDLKHKLHFKSNPDHSQEKYQDHYTSSSNVKEVQELKKLNKIKDASIQNLQKIIKELNSHLKDKSSVPMTKTQTNNLIVKNTKNEHNTFNVMEPNEKEASKNDGNEGSRMKEDQNYANNIAMKKQNKELEQRLIYQQNINESLRREGEAISRSLDELTSINKQIKDENNTLQNIIKAHQIQLKQQNNRLENHQQDHQLQLKREDINASQIKSQLRLTQEKLNQKVQQLQENIERQQAIKKKLKIVELQKNSREIELEETIINLKNMLKQQVEKDKLRNEQTRLQNQQLKVLRSEHDECQNKQDQSQAQIQRLQKRLEDFEEKQKMAANQQEQLLLTLKNVSNEEFYKKEIDRLNNKIQSLEGTIQAIEAQGFNSKNENMNLRNQVANLKTAGILSEQKVVEAERNLIIQSSQMQRYLSGAGNQFEIKISKQP